ncbi:hypothetical protein PYW08_015189 [Mythimna loreyi]|uniref:Uncharacterized protein n=1 Tax=Mythimna loreyi TaxID=667449 RepID=A0ACC2QX70_9NEOP|nr:hypothetical protein PYW08_015189 [Mythimna loreyi]
MSAESPRHVRSGGPLTVPSQPPSDRSIIDAVSGFINDVTLSSSSTLDPKDVIQWARFETADINEPTPEGDGDNDVSPLLLILGYGSGVQVWLIPPTGEAQEVLSWRQGTVRVLRILPTPQHGDCFASKRPLIALCDSVSPGPSFCSLSFISIKGGEQVKSIKFKNPILDVLANKRSVVVSFSERFAVFDAATLEDRMAVTTCYPCPCPLGGSLPVNPLALGDRWLAYADKKLNQSKRSSGGCEGEGVTSYTATVLHAAKSLSKGLRGLGESVAHSLAGGRSTSQSPSPPNADIQQPGVVTILDIEGNEEEDGQDSEEACDPIVAHFIAHSEAIIALKFDASGMLLMTADRRGHDFHVFRINPHPCGASLASVHHLYILHRGDTTAKVQDIAISCDSRWAAVSTLRGTTHVFAISPYGGAIGVRTHTQPRVVNRLSRFHRSAGLPIHTAAQKRASATTVGDNMSQGAWFPNPRLPPYPLPTTLAPLAQLRPTANIPTHTITRNSSGRQRLSSLSEDNNAAPLLARARFGPAVGGRAPAPVAALYLMAANGELLHLLLHPRPLSSLSKEKICDDSAIELEVEPVAQWPLQRPAAAADLLAPLPPSNPLLQPQTCRRCSDMCMSEEERWLSQVEIVTHAGPHRRLWMGPQFVFKTYNCTGSSSSLSEAETVEVDTSAARGVARSNPVNMPGVRPVVPVLIDSGSASSLEHSPSDSFRRKSLLAESGRAASVCDVQLREDLAEAMKEDHGAARESSAATRSPEPRRGGVARAVDPLGTVVQPPPAEPPAAWPEPFAASNCDEATFRPVLRAPAPPEARPEDAARPLPRTTTIPVQSLRSDPAERAAAPTLHALSTARVIPAALSGGGAPPGSAPSFNLDKYSVEEATREVKDARASARSSASAERGCEAPPDSLPKRRPSGDIQPAARHRVRRSPTPKSDSERRASDDSSKNKKSSRIRDSPQRHDDDARASKSTEVRERRESTPKTERVIKMEPVQSEFVPKEQVPKVTSSRDPIAKDSVLKEPISKKTTSRESLPKEVVTTEPSSKKTASKEYLPKDGVTTEPNSKKTASRESLPKDDVTNEPNSKKTASRESLPREVVTVEPISKKTASRERLPKEVVTKEPISKKAASKESLSKEVVTKEPISKKLASRESVPKESVSREPVVKEPVPKEPVVMELAPKDGSLKEPFTTVDTQEEVPSVAVTLKLSSKKKSSESKSTKEKAEDQIKMEEQAWDMLLNEPEKPVLYNIPPFEEKTVEEPKPKSKKNRKGKKPQDDGQMKDEDTFVEIHAIDDKPQPSSGDLVSISTPYEDIEPMSYLAKTKKTRSSKSVTPDTKDLFDATGNWPFDETENASVSKTKKIDDDDANEFFSESSQKMKAKESDTDVFKTDTLKVFEGTGESISPSKESQRPKKTKSLSPYADRKSTEKRYETDVTDVYVIDTMKDDFPEIQITKGNKIRKKSPQPEKKIQEVEVVEKPVKSWSSIAASKNVKKEEKTEEKVEIETTEKEIEIRDLEEEAGSSTQVSLQEKLMELCKRTDIMVAECDAPTELNFVEEHHSVLDLPPLEPLDFGLDDFKLEVMRDSLLEMNDGGITSPICKINIDNILSTIKETTNKAIESSAFNLIDLEKVPSKREKGFSVVENDKITTQEIKIEEDKSEEKEEGMDKSSDDDNTSPIGFTDSDKEDKKSTVPTTTSRYEAEQEELSSSSFSSASRASLDPPSSPTPSCGGDNQLHFPGDSSSSV